MGYNTTIYTAPPQVHELLQLQSVTTAPPDLRYVFLGRVSTEDMQDPATSLGGQLARATTALPPGAAFSGWYWDVESGMLPLDQRGQGDYTDLLDQVELPRTGSVHDCVHDAHQGAYDVAVVDEISRTARNPLTSMAIEEQLQQAGVLYRIAAEPPGMSDGAESARYILRETTRMTAGWYRLQMREQLERGQRERTRMGYTHGSAPYGYVSVSVEDERPRTASNSLFGERVARTLELGPDARKPATVRQIFQWYLSGVNPPDIAQRLNARTDLYPPLSGRWHTQFVHRILQNPKYSGYAVFNRRGKGGRIRPLAEWVWSPEPAHPEIVSLESWVAAQKMPKVRVGGKQRKLSFQDLAKARGFDVAQSCRDDKHVRYEGAEGRMVLPRTWPGLSTARAVLNAAHSPVTVAETVGPVVEVATVTRIGRRWVAGVPEWGVATCAGGLTALQQRVTAALALASGTASVAVGVNVRSAAVEDLDAAREVEADAVAGVVAEMRPLGVSWTDIARVAEVPARRLRQRFENDGAEGADSQK